ncbi:MAG: response regulator [Bacteroidales bacterium]|nr:response regulator [Bacteroidales bacterium]
MVANFDWSGKTILIAEDDYYSSAYLRELFSRTGATIIHVDNGLRAFAECLKNPEINLVLMDVKLPIVNGLESTRLIKKYKPHIKVIAQTAFAMVGDRNRCLSAGCDEYITKPIDPADLFSKIYRLFTYQDLSAEASEQIIANKNDHPH